MNDQNQPAEPLSASAPDWQREHLAPGEWNPGKRDQAYARTDRIGQELENDVYIYRIPASIDTWMSNTIYRKEKMVSAFQDTMGDDVAEMSAESLNEAMRSGEIL